MSRPRVAVVLPFHGTAEDADAALAELARLSVRDGDEVVLADNTLDDVAAARPRADHIEVLSCEVKQSAYAARNIGAESTSAPWILFVDADCLLPEGLLDAYFDPAPGATVGAVAGQVLGDPDQPGLIPAYIRSRGHLDQEWQLSHPHRPMAVTANLLVSRAAWEEVGGFAEMTASGADADFSFRLQDAGWTLDYRPDALVLHEHRETLASLLAQARRDGSAAPWLARAHRGYPATAPWTAFLRSLAGAIGWPLLGQPRRGLFKGLDGLWSAAFNVGALGGNRRADPAAAPRTVVLVEEFPSAGDPLVDAVAEAAAPGLLVEALRRPLRGDWGLGRRVDARHWEDRGAPARVSPLAAPARRVSKAESGGLLLAEPQLSSLATKVRTAAGRDDLVLELLPADRAAAAERIRQVR